MFGVVSLSLVAEHPDISPVARSATAVSREAESVWVGVNDVITSHEQSLALFGPKAAAISQIWELVEECASENWDGYGAEPLSEIAAEMAADFIRALPENIPLPGFAPDPDGSISLDWNGPRYHVFSLGIGTSNRLPYAWLDGANKGYGVEYFDRETVHRRVLDGIRMTVERES